MASYFGEIIEPSTRALFDEFEDDDDVKTNKRLQLVWNQNAPTTVDLFFVVHGRLSLAFAEAYLVDDNTSLIGEINLQQDNDDSHKSLPSRIYLEGTTLICLVSPSCTSDLAFQFVENISTILKNSKRVIVLTNETIYKFKTAFINELPPAFMRELKTSTDTSKELADKLPIPNIITGIPGAVATWCQIFKKSASILICYTDQQRLDSVTALPYTTVIKKINPKLILKNDLDLNKKYFYGNPEIIGGSSNIYI